MYDLEIDTRSHSCPLPILKAYQTIRTMSDNQVLKIVADTSSEKNFNAFTKSARDTAVLHQESTNETLTLLLRKG